MNREIKVVNNCHAKERIKIVGPGTVAMVICMLLLLSWQLLKPQKIAIERKVEASGNAVSMRLPTTGELLEWRTTVGLSDDQANKITLLRNSESAALKPVEERIAEITAQVDANSKIGGRTDNGALGLLVGQLAGPSRTKRELERRFSEQAWALLGKEQKDRALGLWRLHWSTARRKVTGQ